MVIKNLLEIASEKRDKNDSCIFTLNAIESILEGKDHLVRSLVKKIDDSI